MANRQQNVNDTKVRSELMSTATLNVTEYDVIADVVQHYIVGENPAKATI